MNYPGYFDWICCMKSNAWRLYLTGLIAFWGAFISACSDIPTGPQSQVPDRASLKDSADSAKYFVALYRGLWIPIVDTLITFKEVDSKGRILWDTVNQLGSIEYLKFEDSIFFLKYKETPLTYMDSIRYIVTSHEYCEVYWDVGGDQVGGCKPHPFRGRDTMDLSSNTDAGNHILRFRRFQ
jgi:hypothetical protein